MESKSAFGGSADSQARDGETSAWTSHPVLSGAIRLAVFAVPLGSALLVVRATARVVPAPSSVAGWLVWAIATAGIAFATVTLVERVTRRALPLAALLRLSLVFPDETPSRMRVALRTGTAKDLERRLAEGGTLGDTASEAATNLLILLRRLNDHDRLTRGHSERVRAYSDVIAEELGLVEADRQKLHWAALSHDLGKLTVPPEILNSPGRPTEAEWEVLRGHPAAASTIVEPLRPWLGDWLMAATQHHERWDGRGYPAGLDGKDIHLSGRIVAVADAFDTMTSARSYKKPLALADARAELTRNAGSQFDPAVVRAFMGVGMHRLRLVAGPLSWLAGLPAASGATSVLTGGGVATVATSVAGVAAVVATSVGLGMQVPNGMDETAAGFADQDVAVDELAYWEDILVTSTIHSSVPLNSSTTTVPSSTTISTTTMPTSATSQTTTSLLAPTTTSLLAPTTTARAQPTTTAATTAPTITATTAKPTTTATTAANQGEDCVAVQGGQRPLANLDLFNCDLNGLNLAGVNMNGANLDGANFSGANLSSATIRDADVEGANFDGANLTGADMRFSGWDFSSFVGAVLSGANLRDSDAESINFTGADLTSTILGDTGIGNSNFTNANLTGSTGQPNDGPLAIWSNTTCSNGTVQSTSCYAS